MKLFIFFLLIAICLAAADDEKYTSRYDGIDIDEILQSNRLFDNYFKCLMDKGKCTPDGRELKRTLPDALKTECKKCTEKQRQGSEKVFKFLIEKKRDEWKVLADKYDPEGIYMKKYEAEAKKRGYDIPK